MPDVYASGDIRKLSNGIFMAANYIADDFDAGMYPIGGVSSPEEMLTVLNNTRRMPEIFEESDQVSLPFPKAPAFVRVSKDGVVVLLTQDPDGYFSRKFMEAFEDEEVEAEVQ